MRWVRSRPLRWVGSSVSGMRFGLTSRTRRRTRRSDKPPGEGFAETILARRPLLGLPPEPFPKRATLDRLTQRPCRSLQTVTDLGELSGGEVNSLLLGVRAALLSLGL